MTRLRLYAAACLCLLLAVLTSVSVASADTPTARASKKKTITMSGSTSVAPLASKLAKAYLRSSRRVRRRVRFRLLQGGSDIGISDVAHGRVTIGNSSRDPQPSDPGGLVFNKIARDGVCIVTNRANGISNISQASIQSIFSGRVRSWGRVSGAGVSGPIDLVVRTAASGTQDAFQNIFMGPRLRISPSATTKSSNGLLVQSVRSNPNAIGYSSLNFTRGTHAIPYRGVRCNLRNAKSGSYLGTRNFWMVTRGRARGRAKAFIRWIRRSRRARRIISKSWVPIR
jgi:phosphate transport system substrate-binding protein